MPTPKHTHIARPIIKQVASLTDFCRGCGMCEKICPNNAIHPVRNPDQRRHLLAKDNGPLKRGGRTKGFVIYDGPFYADRSLGEREARAELCARVKACMRARAEEFGSALDGSYRYIKVESPAEVRTESVKK